MKQDIKKLDPKKHLISRIFRKYRKDKQETNKIVKKTTEIEQKKPKQTHKTKKHHPFAIKNILITLLLVLITISLIMLFMPTQPTINFIDKATNTPLEGYVYLDESFLGETDGLNFDKLPKEYCESNHQIRLESETNSFEWPTLISDCEAKKIKLEVEYQKAKPSENIIFKFLDNTGSYYIKGKLYFNGIFIQEADNAISISRTQCKTITKIKLDQEVAYYEWDNNINLCNSHGEIKFKITS
jgi:hypothetical protein